MGRLSSPKMMRRPREMAIFLCGSVLGLLFSSSVLFARVQPRDNTTIHKATPTIGALQQQHEPPTTTTTTLVNLVIPPPKNVYTEHQPDIDMKASRTLFNNMPAGHDRTFSSSGMRAQSMIRALRALGWQKVDDIQDARLVWHHAPKPERVDSLLPWQRYNHIPNTTTHFSKLHRLSKGFRRYYNLNKSSLRPHYFPPHSYDLNVPEQRAEFQKLQTNHKTWVLRKPSRDKKDVLRVVSHSDLQRNLLEIVKRDVLAQPYICNKLKLDDKHTFVVRMFWFVASLDPLLAFSMDGYVHLDSQDKLSFHQFEQYLVQMSHKDNVVSHVRNQLKEAIGQLVDAFRETSFRNTSVSEDGFGLYSADFIIDDDLDVWLMEAHDDATQLDEDNYFRLDLNHEICIGMATTLAEVWDKQVSGKSILPLVNTGKWELVYANGWKFEYNGYERRHESKLCDAH